MTIRSRPALAPRAPRGGASTASIVPVASPVASLVACTAGPSPVRPRVSAPPDDPHALGADPGVDAESTSMPPMHPAEVPPPPVGVARDHRVAVFLRKRAVRQGAAFECAWRH
jgi:hypothetical protein